MLRKSETAIICITGYAGSGKSTMSNMLENHLPNARCIHVDDYYADYVTQFPEDVEQIFGQPVDTSNGLLYLEKFVRKLDVREYKKFCDAFNLYANYRLAKDATSIISAHQPRFLIVEHYMLPILCIWKRADYKLLIQTNKLELQSELLSNREIFAWDRSFAKIVNSAARECIENIAESVDYTIHNNFDDNFNEHVKNIALQILEVLGT